MAEPDASDQRPGVVDLRDENRFVIRTDGYEAELVYRSESDRLVLVHTGVPDELGGRGLGADLVRAALDRARQEGLTVAPWCPFARKWIEEHEDEVGEVELDLAPPPPRS